MVAGVYAWDRMREPMAAPLAAVAGGVFAARYASLPDEQLVIAGALCAALALLGLYDDRLWAGKAACLLGMALAGAALPSVLPSSDKIRMDRAVEGLDLEVPVRLSGWVREPPERFEDADRIVLEAETALDGKVVHGGVRLTIHRNEGDPPLDIRYGRRVEVLARLRRLHGYQNPGSFDRVRHLHRQGIYMTGTTRPYAPLLPLEGCGGSGWEELLWTLRSTVARRFESLAFQSGAEGAPAAAILRSTLLGDRGALDRETETEFQRSGTYHVLVVSGLHVGLLTGSLWLLLVTVGAPRALAATAGLFAAAGYALLLQSPLPAMRAAWMLAAFVAASLFYRRRRALNALAAVALGFLAVDPETLFEPGFQLSFGAVAAIAGIAVPLIDEWISPHLQASRDLRNRDLDLHLGPAITERRTALRRRLEPLAAVTKTPLGLWSGAHRWLWIGISTVLVSAVLQVALAVPSAMHFQRIATASPITNLAAMPLVSALVPVGFLALATNSVSLFSVAAWLAERLAATARLGADANLDLRTPQPPDWLAAAMLVTLTIWWWTLSRKSPWRRSAGAAVAAAFCLIVWHPFAPQADAGRMELTTIDVGQGDALLLVGPQGDAVVIDAGGLPNYGGRQVRFDVGEAVVSPYLWSRSIQRLRALAVTHPDADHMGGAAAVLRNFQVEELWLGSDGFEEEYRELTDIARQLGIPTRRLHAGEQIELGEASIEVLSPEHPLAASANDRSLAMAVRYGEQVFLLTGDLETEGERRVVSRLPHSRAGFLKVAHHGSDTSTGGELLGRLEPAIATVSAGYQNVHGHPSPRVVARLRARRTMILRTDVEGTVTVQTDGRRLAVETFRRNQSSTTMRR